MNLRALVITVVAGGLVAACGIRPSGVISGIEAPKGGIPSVMVYFLDKGRPRPVARAVTDGDPNHVLLRDQPLPLLFAGPTDTERASGLSSDIPAGSTGMVDWKRSTRATTVTVLVSSTAPLSEAAVEEIVCTGIAAANISGYDRPHQATVISDYGDHTAKSCPVPTP